MADQSQSFEGAAAGAVGVAEWVQRADFAGAAAQQRGTPYKRSACGIRCRHSQGLRSMIAAEPCVRKSARSRRSCCTARSCSVLRLMASMEPPGWPSKLVGLGKRSSWPMMLPCSQHGALGAAKVPGEHSSQHQPCSLAEHCAAAQASILGHVARRQLRRPRQEPTQPANKQLPCSNLGGRKQQWLRTLHPGRAKLNFSQLID